MFKYSFLHFLAYWHMTTSKAVIDGWPLVGTSPTWWWYTYSHGLHFKIQRRLAGIYNNEHVSERMLREATLLLPNCRSVWDNVRHKRKSWPLTRTPLKSSCQPTRFLLSHLLKFSNRGFFMYRMCSGSYLFLSIPDSLRRLLVTPCRYVILETAVWC